MRYLISSVFVVFIAQIYGQNLELKTKNARGFQIINNKTYFFSPKSISLTQHEAHLTCLDMGMQLVSLETPEENKAIKEYMDKNNIFSAWTSGQRALDVWVWGPTGERLSHSDWRTKYPSKTNICKSIGVQLYISNSMGWTDEYSDDNSSFICEYPDEKNILK